jgi:hypothetical protein
MTELPVTRCQTPVVRELRVVDGWHLTNDV